LLELLADPRHLGATPGLLMALHTWGRTLSQHPHVHCLVSAGGADAKGQWRATRERWLLPLEPLRRLFRGKLLAQVGAWLRERRLVLPEQQPSGHWRQVVRGLYRKHWNVQVCEPYASGRSVALYLSRYVKGGPLPKERALSCTNQQVSFGYTDHRDGQRKTMCLGVQQFIARVLWHAPPRGMHTTRHAGLYASARREQHRACALLLTRPASLPVAVHSESPSIPITSSPPCPVCQLPLTRHLLPRVHQQGEFSRAEVRNTSNYRASPGPTGRSSVQPRASPLVDA
jgi:hypothetical protein